MFVQDPRISRHTCKHATHVSYMRFPDPRFHTRVFQTHVSSCACKHATRSWGGRIQIRASVPAFVKHVTRVPDACFRACVFVHGTRVQRFASPGARFHTRGCSLAAWLLRDPVCEWSPVLAYPSGRLLRWWVRSSRLFWWCFLRLCACPSSPCGHRGFPCSLCSVDSFGITDANSVLFIVKK